MVAATTSPDALKMLREMLRQAERGEVVLTGLRIKNTQKDQWDSRGGMDRLRLDNTFKVELEMHANDRGATPRPSRGVTVDVDEAALEVLTQPSIDYVTLQGRNARQSYRLPAQPIKTLQDRIMDTNIRMNGEYTCVRISYETRDRLMLEQIVSPGEMDASPVSWLGLDLIIEAPDGRTRAQLDDSLQPRFDDTDPRYYDDSLDNITGNVESRRTLNEAMRSQPPRGVPSRVRVPKPKVEKPKTPAGASAAREIIFDD